MSDAYKAWSVDQHIKTSFKFSRQPSYRHLHPELALLFRIREGGRKSPAEQKYWQSQGVKEGVPQLFLPATSANFKGLFIYIKGFEGFFSPEQRWWYDRLKAQGYSVAVCEGWEDATRELQSYCYKI